MTVRWTVRTATDRGPQAESRVLFGAPKRQIPIRVSVFFMYQLGFKALSPCFGRRIAAVNWLTGQRSQCEMKQTR